MSAAGNDATQAAGGQADGASTDTDTSAEIVPAHIDLTAGLSPVWERVDAEQVVEGEPSTATSELGAFGGVELGVWQITPGVVTDVEADEVFVVLSGRARIDFLSTADAEAGAPVDAAPVDVSAGSIVRLVAGTHTRWTVTETLRKVYLA